MARGKRATYSAYIECAFLDVTLFLHQKLQTYKKDAWYVF
jgi:hypothetical protein